MLSLMPVALKHSSKQVALKLSYLEADSIKTGSFDSFIQAGSFETFH